MSQLRSPLTFRCTTEELKLFNEAAAALKVSRSSLIKKSTLETIALLQDEGLLALPATNPTIAPNQMTPATIDLIPAFAVFVNDLATVTVKDRIAGGKVAQKT